MEKPKFYNYRISESYQYLKQVLALSAEFDLKKLGLQNGYSALKTAMDPIIFIFNQSAHKLRKTSKTQTPKTKNNPKTQATTTRKRQKTTLSKTTMENKLIGQKITFS